MRHREKVHVLSTLLEAKEVKHDMIEYQGAPANLTEGLDFSVISSSKRLGRGLLSRHVLYSFLRYMRFIYLEERYVYKMYPCPL